MTNHYLHHSHPPLARAHWVSDDGTTAVIATSECGSATLMLGDACAHRAVKVVAKAIMDHTPHREADLTDAFDRANGEVRALLQERGDFASGIRTRVSAVTLTETTAVVGSTGMHTRVHHLHSGKVSLIRPFDTRYLSSADAAGIPHDTFLLTPDEAARHPVDVIEANGLIFTRAVSRDLGLRDRADFSCCVATVARTDSDVFVLSAGWHLSSGHPNSHGEGFLEFVNSRIDELGTVKKALAEKAWGHDWHRFSPCVIVK